MGLGFKKQDLGMLLGGAATMAGGPFSMLAIPALYKMFADDQDEQSEMEKVKFARNMLISGEAPREDGDITWNTARPASDQEMRGAAGVAAPDLAIKQRLAQMFPQSDEYLAPTAGVDAQGNPAFGQFGKAGGFKGPQGFRPAAENKGPGSRGLFRDRKTGKIFPGYESAPGIQQALQRGEIELAQEPKETPVSERPFHIMTPEAAQAAGLPQGTWKTNGINFDRVDAQNQAPSGYRPTQEGNLEVIPGGPADQKGLPGKYKDQNTAFIKFNGLLGDYEKLLDEVGTEYWDSTKAAQLASMQTQIGLGIKDLEQTGALDKGSVEYTAAMIPDATGFLANADVFRGTSRAKAKLGELKKYVARGKGALDQAYRGSMTPQTPAAAGIGTIPGMPGFSIREIK